MLRATTPADTPILQRITAETGFFKPHEVETLKEVLDDYHSENEAEGHICRTMEKDGQVVGFVYFAPAPMTLGTWQLWWIVVAKDAQSKGLGGEMLKYAEDEARRRKGRVMFIETGSVPLYEPTRQFYLKHGYERHAVLEDFYAIGDSMVIFRKSV